MMKQVNVLTTGGHKCIHCGLVAKSRAGLRRHQSGEQCRATQEELFYEKGGFKRIRYHFLRSRATWKRRKVDPCVVARAKALGVDWFDSPSFHQFAYIPTWFWLTWVDWPKKIEGVVHCYSAWERKKRGKGHTLVQHNELGAIPDESFDAVVRDALAHPQALVALRLRVAAGVLDAYFKEDAGLA